MAKQVIEIPDDDDESCPVCGAQEICAHGPSYLQPGEILDLTDPADFAREDAVAGIPPEE